MSKAKLIRAKSHTKLLYEKKKHNIPETMKACQKDMPTKKIKIVTYYFKQVTIY